MAYHFENGEPDRWTGRIAIIAWMIVPQVIIVLLAAATVSAAARLVRRLYQGESAPVMKVLAIMGNMVALPQVILAFAMLDIFLYNSYRIHLFSLWIFTLMVMALGGIILGILLMQSLRQFRRL